MADKPTTTDVGAGAQYDASVINNNLATLEDAIEGCLGRGGTGESPNSMSGDLDMDLNQIKNMPTPLSDKDGANKAYVDGKVSSLLAVDQTDVTTSKSSGSAIDWDAALTNTIAGVCETYTELRAVIPNIDGDGVLLLGRASKGDGGGGVFYWDSSDLSTEVAEDTQSGIYVAPSSDLTGASGAWVRQGVSFIDVRWCGLVGDGTTNNFDVAQPAFDIAAYLGVPLVYPSGDWLHTGNADVISITDENNATIIIEDGAKIVKDGGNYFIAVDGNDTSKLDNITIDIRGEITVPTVGSSVANGGVKLGSGTAREYGTISIPNLTTRGMGQYGLATGSQAQFIDRLILGRIECVENGTTAVNVLSDPIVLKPGQGTDDTTGHIKELIFDTLIVQQDYNFAVAPIGTAAGKLQYIQVGVGGKVYARGGTEITVALDHCNMTIDLIDLEATDADGLQLSGESTTNLLIGEVNSYGTPSSSSSITLGSTGTNGVHIGTAKLTEGIVSTTNAVHDNFQIDNLVAETGIGISASGSKITNSRITNIVANGRCNINADNSEFDTVKGYLASAVNGFVVNGDGNKIKRVNWEGTLSGAYPVEINGDSNQLLDCFQYPGTATRSYNIQSGTGNILRNCKSPSSANIRDTGTNTKVYDSQINDISPDSGDAGVTVTNGITPKQILFDTPLTLNRGVNPPSVTYGEGASYRIIRTANSTGAFVVSVAGGLTTLDPAEWCEIMFDGSSWVLIGKGSLA